MMAVKFKAGDKVTITGRSKIYEVLKTNDLGNKVLVQTDGVQEWVYADWLKLYESLNFVYKAIKFLISLFKKKKP